jgi:SanA protein
MSGRFWLTGLALVLLCAGVVIALLIFVETKASPYVYESAEAAPTSTVALVLGASVYQNGSLSPVLSARADRALELYRAGKVKKILVTGDNGDLSHNEVNPVGNYLLERGVPKGDIFLDHAGFDTYSSMYRARDVFEVHDMLVVSQPFHLARAIFIARELGMNARGVKAAGEATPYNSLREIPATLKALLDLGVSRAPKYLGSQYPVSGDGSATWADSTSTPQIPLH